MIHGVVDESSTGGRVALPQKKSVDQGSFVGAVSGVVPMHLDQLAKRLFDLVAGTMCLALFAPTLLIISIAIKFDSRGPIFIRETLYGYKNQAIQIRKFRIAMVCSEGEQINPRLTRVGQFLRRTGIDELPQLFNVLRGEMSVFGPRPCAYPTALLSEHKPGITGWTEILGFQNGDPC